MSFISYAQNFEDVMLRRALNNVERGFYIDIGAWSPDFDSVTRAFYERGWHGINVEPDKELLQQFNDRRPRDINLGFAVSDHSGRDKITLFPGTGLSTLSHEIASAHQQSGFTGETQDVELTTLEQIYKTYLPADQPVHFLKVDVEGLERQVLQGNDWKSCRPWVVVVEATRPLSQVESYTEWEYVLEDAGYRFCYADGLNRFYLAPDHSGLETEFRYPPNVFDDFITYPNWLNQRKLEEAQGIIDEVSANLNHAIQREKVAKAEATAEQNRADALDIEAQSARLELEKLSTELEVAMRNTETLRGELSDVYKSKSWRVTWPLRKAMVLARLVRHLTRNVLTTFVSIPRRVAHHMLARLISCVLRSSTLKGIARRILRRFPRIEKRIWKFSEARGIVGLPARDVGRAVQRTANNECMIHLQVQIMETPRKTLHTLQRDLEHVSVARGQ